MLDATIADPMVHFDRWFAEAKEKELNDPNAMSLATATKAGVPTVRIVLLKGVDARGFAFFTNFESRKGQELLENPVAGLNFHWKSVRRQVRIEGAVEIVSPEESDAYFASRPHGSQIGAWASIQSRRLDERHLLEDRVREFEAKYGEGQVPRPPHWSGFRVIPARIEFWQDMPFRLHDRLVYARENSFEPWTTERLYP